MLSRDLIEDLTREKRKYDKSGAFSKKKRLYLTEGELKNIVMSLKAYQTWITRSGKDARITYYRGYMVEPSIQPIAPTMDRNRVEKLQKAVYDTYVANLVSLVQKRHGKFDYEYIAVRK